MCSQVVLSFVTSKNNIALSSWGSDEGHFSGSEKTANLEVTYLSYNL